MFKGKKEILIFSVMREECSPSLNWANTRETIKRLDHNKIPYKLLDGIYKGNTEQAILVPKEFESYVQSLCQQYNQECYLYSDHQRQSYLIYPNGNKDKLGTLRAVSKEYAQTHDAYSHDVTTDQYWVCK